MTDIIKTADDISNNKNGVVIKRIIGPVGSITYEATSRLLEFSNGFPSHSATAVLDETVVTQGELYYEVEIVEKGICASTSFGFALQNAFEKTNVSEAGVGDNDRSWGVDGLVKKLWHNGDDIPLEMEHYWQDGDVIGLAVNIDMGKIAYSVNGSWSKEFGCGIVFEKCYLREDDGIGVCPSLSSSEMKVCLNVKENHLRYSKPSEEVWQSLSYAERIKRREDHFLKKEEEDIESQRKQGDGIIVKRITGPPGSVTFDTTSRLLEFNKGFPIAVLEEIVVTQGVLYYEVEIVELVEMDTHAQFGFALQNAFEKTNNYTGMGVGENPKSWGVDGFRKYLWHNYDLKLLKMEHNWKVGDVIGLAVNIDMGKIAYSKNGCWSKEFGCGVVFEKCSFKEDDGIGVYPSLSSSSMKVCLNVTEKHLRYSKPYKEVWQSLS